MLYFIKTPPAHPKVLFKGGFIMYLLVTFSPIVSLAEHLTIAYICCPAMAPCRNVVSIHFTKFPDPFCISIMA